MKEILNELIIFISIGCMGVEEIWWIVDEVVQVYVDLVGFFVVNLDINYDDSFLILFGEWVVVGSLLDIVLFQVDIYVELFVWIVVFFGKDVVFNIKLKQLFKIELLVVFNCIQV